MKTITLSRNWIHSSLRRRAFFLIPLPLTCVALMPMAQAVGPDTDGSIPGSNNGEGVGVLVSRTTGVWNTGTGFEALNHLTVGNQNTATGLRALFSDTSGGYNTATGVYSLYSNTTGFFNSATGAYSLANNIGGSYNTANGYAALSRNTASNNTASGFAALYTNLTGTANTATGYSALFSNRSGHRNTASGENALFSNTTGFSNTAVGAGALLNNTSAFHNTALGFSALISNSDGTYNTAIGSDALGHNTSGSSNVAVGAQALDGNTTGNYNVAVGGSALQGTTGSRNIGIGSAAGVLLTTGDDNIDIGNGFSAVAGESGTIRIGTPGTQTATFIAGISGATTPGGVAVYVNSDGRLGTLTSSARFKADIKPMDKTSEAVFALEPVIFRYKPELDPKGIPQFGLVAEDVAKVNPDLVARDDRGKVYTVRYEAVNAMLLNEFLKEHRKVEQLTKDFESKLAHQQKQIEALTAGLQKVSAQLELGKPASQTVKNTD
jgi:hypothetical protein